MSEKDNNLKNVEPSSEQNCSVVDTNNMILPVHPSVPTLEIRPLDRVKEPSRRKRSRELER